MSVKEFVYRIMLIYINFKDDVHPVLRISSAHNKGGPQI
jgi:hypothetical protein